MSGQEYRKGEILDITIRVRVHSPGGPGFLIVDYPEGPRVTLPVDHPAVTVTRVAPPEWPPVPGDLWRDRLGYPWFAVDVADYDSSDEATVELQSPDNYSYGRLDPDCVNQRYGPMTLVHREPESGGRDE